MSVFKIAAPLHTQPQPELQEIEVSSSLQIPAFKIIGLPGPEVSEASERIRAAFQSGGLEFPKRRVILNLSPSSVRKQGTSSDLAMALAVLKNGSARPTPAPLGFGVAWGELGLDGRIKATGRPLRSVSAAWEAGADWVVYPASEHDEILAARREFQNVHAAPPPEPRWIPAETLEEAWRALQDPAKTPPRRRISEEPSSAALSIQDPALSLSKDSELDSSSPLLPLSPALLRTLEIAATGRHPLLLWGPKGTGKSHALEWLIALSPPVSSKIQLERKHLAELVGHLESAIRHMNPRVRPEALLGSMNHGKPRPGELSLAHGGLLLADEFPEWSRDAREALRDPMESGEIRLSRAEGQLRWPARFHFAATANLCPCGGDSILSVEVEASAQCRCSLTQRLHYRERLSGPLLDRLDLILLVSERVCTRAFLAPETVRPILHASRERVHAARLRLLSQWGGALPSELPAAQMEETAQALGKNLTGITLRGRHRVARVAHSIAALEGTFPPTTAHWLEASRLRLTANP